MKPVGLRLSSESYFPLATGDSFVRFFVCSYCNQGKRMLSRSEQEPAQVDKVTTKAASPDGILLSGHLRKHKVVSPLSFTGPPSNNPSLCLQQMKKKYFILFGENEGKPARLEYFESEKKWKSGCPAKR